MEAPEVSGVLGALVGCDGCGALGWNWELLEQRGWRSFGETATPARPLLQTAPLP